MFSQDQELETIVWNTLLGNLLKDGSLEGVFLTYSHMVTHGVSLDISTFHFLVHACSRSFDLQRGSEIHGRVLKSGMGRNRSLNNNLMGFYSKCGKFENVQRLFDKLTHRDVISWNTMISCYVQMGLPGEALDVFREMRASGVAADEITMISLLSACSKLRDLETGERLHGYIEENGLEISGNLLNCLANMYIECGAMERAHELVARSEVGGDVVLWTSLVGGYVKAKRIHAARCVFDHIAEKNLISWMTMISGYVQGGYYNESLELFIQMRHANVVPDEVLTVTALSASTRVEERELGRSIHGLVVKFGMVVDGLLGNSLIHLYAKCGEPNEAHLVFKQLPSRSVASWNSMLDGFCRSGEFEKAKSFFNEIPNKDVISWNTMINTLAKSYQFGELFELFREMQSSSAKPDKLTLISVLSSCASAGALSHGIWVHAYIEKNRIEIDNMVGTALIDMYGKCGSVEKARELFYKLTEKNAFVWTAMIAAHAMEGQAGQAIDLYLEMEAKGIKPDHVTFIALLSGCSHGGLLDQGLEYFNKMSSVHGIMPNVQHYGCIVDLLGRTGHLDEALEFIKLMPIQPDISIWSALLRASRSHHSVALAEHAFQRLIELDPLNDSAYVLLSNTYAKAGRLDDLRHTRKKLFELGIRKKPGCSVIEKDGTMYEFTASDFSNPESAKIYTLLEEIKGDLDKLGLEDSSAHHSERLAVAFGLISTCGTTPIRVANNLRICGDCHIAMKLMSQVYDREIVIRDNYRFHRFVDGNCTCKDLW